MKPNFSKGLIPAIVIDDQTNDVLMLAYMNEEAYDKTIETKQTWFYSRSRESLWNKGATSGNIQTVESIQIDCDEDTIVVRVTPAGPACHTGEQSCFYRSIDLDTGQVTDAPINNLASVIDQVMAEVVERKSTKQENSYTNYLFDKGIDKIGKKVIEEAGEVVIAAKNEDKQEIINEVSDLLYHSFVLLANQNITLAEVKAELNHRFAKKGNSKGDRPEIKEW